MPIPFIKKKSDSNSDMLSEVFLLDDFEHAASHDQIFELIDDAVKGHSLIIGDYYFAAERNDPYICVFWFPKADVDAIAKARNGTLADAVWYIAREARDLFEHSFSLYQQGIVH